VRLLALTAALPLLLTQLACSDGTGTNARDNTLPSSGSSTGSGNNSAAVNSAVTGTGASGGSTTGFNPQTGEVSEDCGSVLPVLFRDFKGSGEAGGHPDFELSARGVTQDDGQVYKGWNDVGCELVETTLGNDSKPVPYTGAANVAEGGPEIRAGVGRQKRVVSGPGCWTEADPTPPGVCNIGTCVPWDFNPPTHEIDASTFGTWFNTDATYNMEIPQDLVLTETPPDSGTYVYDSTEFFPLDGLGFGNTPNEAHNYHFTTEVHVSFTYEPGQVFTFRGDDDLWIFVNNRLALDVGGAHQALEGTIDFDARANELGLSPGGQYQMDIFHAERQTSESNFRIETTIRCFEPVEIVK
jgi:fibro-slime domain-containing protein